MSKIVLNPSTDLKLPLDDLGNNNQTNTNPNNALGSNSDINGVSHVNDFATTSLQQRNFEKEVRNYDFLNNYNQFYDGSNYLGEVPNLESNSAFDNFIFVIVLIFFVVSVFLLVYFVLRYFNVSLF